MGYTRRDRIVKGLRSCWVRWDKKKEDACNECPYHGHQYPCMDEMFGRAIEYISEKHNPRIPEVGFDFETDEDVYYCGECGRRVFRSHKCCPACGEEIDWCEVENE